MRGHCQAMKPRVVIYWTMVHGDRKTLRRLSEYYRSKATPACLQHRRNQHREKSPTSNAHHPRLVSSTPLTPKLVKTPTHNRLPLLSPLSLPRSQSTSPPTRHRHPRSRVRRAIEVQPNDLINFIILHRFWFRARGGQFPDRWVLDRLGFLGASSTRALEGFDALG